MAEEAAAARERAILASEAAAAAEEGALAAPASRVRACCGAPTLVPISLNVTPLREPAARIPGRSDDSSVGTDVVGRRPRGPGPEPDDWPADE